MCGFAISELAPSGQYRYQATTNRANTPHSTSIFAPAHDPTHCR